MARIVIITPGMNGSDGLSMLSRQTVAAVATTRRTSGTQIEVWSLADEPRCPPGKDYSTFVFRGAGANRLRLLAWSVRELAHDAHGVLALVLHLHLSPLALPLSLRGAHVAVVLNGIEAWRRVRCRERVTLQRASTLVAISRETARRFAVANPSFASLAIQVCPLGLPADSDVGDGSGRFALIVGRMASNERYKGHDLLLELWPQVLQMAPGATLLVVGDGDDRLRLQTKATALGLDGKVRFLGRVTDKQLLRLYREAAFFIMPSTGEGFGFVFLEAMRAGRACIGGGGAPSEVVEHGVTGLIVTPHRRDELLAAIVSFFTEEATREAMGRAGRERYLSLFTSRRFQERLLPILGLNA